MVQERRVLLSVKRFKQKVNECAVAAASSLGNYYDSSIRYEESRRLLPFNMRRGGIYTSQQARLLNLMGFDNVTIVTSDLDIVDYTWTKLSKRGLIKKLDRLYKYYRRTKGRNTNLHEIVYDLYSWLSDKRFNNNLIIDNDFAKYIKKTLDRGNPICASVSATTMFKIKKWPIHAKDSDIKGQNVEHSLVIRGYDNKGVYIVDSDHGFGRQVSLRKYVSGYYKVAWEKFLPNISHGDLIFVE